MSVFTRYMLVSLAFIIATAYTSYGFYRADEHFQTIEFASYKLGITPASDLPWEFEAEIRPWLQPAIYYSIFKILSFAGIEDKFTQTFVLRLFSGLCGWAALFAFGLAVLPWFRHEKEKLLQIKIMALLSFLPFIFVRTSSESLSCAFFTAGLAIILYKRAPDENHDSPETHLSGWFAAGLLLGFSFAFRYQTAILIASLILWLLVISKANKRHISIILAGSVIPVVLGVFADRWGNGHWSFPFINYFRVNLIEGKTAQFGTEPFFAYLYLIPANIMAPVTLLLMIAMFVMWYRHPKHIITWLSLPFFLFHCFVPHKEDRFMFPLAIISTTFFILAFSPYGNKVPPLVKKIFQEKNRAWLICLFYFNAAILGFLALYPFGVESNIKMQRYIYENHPKQFEFYALDYDPYKRKELKFAFYKPENLTYSATPQTFVISSMPVLDDNALNSRAERIYSSFFFCEIEALYPALNWVHSKVKAVSCPSIFRIRD